jgi:hypothetical protein
MAVTGRLIILIVWHVLPVTLRVRRSGDPSVQILPLGIGIDPNETLSSEGDFRADRA